MQTLEIITLSGGLGALLTAALAAKSVLRRPKGDRKMIEISEAIKTGASTFLRRQYSSIGLFVVCAAVLLLLAFGWQATVAYICGSLSSMLAGYMGMRIAVEANCRTAQGALKGLQEALQIAFRSGLVMGMLVAGLAVLGVLGFKSWLIDPEKLLPFSFGASTVAIFGRVGGGLYTKTADVGADLVGKVEVGIPEDDPRNPAVIADNVGDNVGDVAGMGADLFESFVAQMIATMIVASVAGLASGYVLLPLAIAGIGTLCSIVSALTIRPRSKNPSYILNFASILSMVLTAVFVAFLSYVLFSSEVIKITVPVVLGLISGATVGLASDYFTNYLHNPARHVARSALTGSATNILSGYAVGLFSCILPIIVIAGAVVLAYSINGLYGICLAGMGMLSVTAMVVSADAYGPVADNAGGIIEQTGHGVKREVTDALDAVGNTTKAISKGFAIGSAALTAIALFVSYCQLVELDRLDLLHPTVVAGAFVGAAVIALFSALVVMGVSRNAFRMVEEVRRQFREIPGLREGKAKPDYGRCVDIATRGALKELVLPALVIILSPFLVGVSLGKEAVGGMLMGSITLGLVFALQMANSGAVWDNAKKYIELGNLGGKGTPAHQSAVVGDTVGDPLKDAAGPSLNIAIKLMSIVALLMALAGIV